MFKPRLIQFVCLFGWSVLFCHGYTQWSLVRVAEAETLEIKCAAGAQPGDNLWASGGFFTPRFFGKAVGDSLTWRFELAAPLEEPVLLVRYAYDEPGYTAFAGSKPPREFQVLVGALKPLKLSFPHTGGWDEYDTVTLKLPPLIKGRHMIRLVSLAEHTTTDIDVLGLAEEMPERLPVPFRPTVIAKAESGRFLLRATAQARFTPDEKSIIAEFEKIYRFMKNYSDWEPTVAIGINVIEDRLWPFGSATAFSDMRGVFFRASVMHKAFGDWCHEMSHWFLVGRSPKWLEEPLVQVLTAMVWMPGIYPGPDPKKDPLYAQGERIGRDVLNSPKRQYEDIAPVLYAIAVKYGPDIYGRFFKACAKAGAKEELVFHPGRHLTRDEIARYLSEAAGESVLPLLKRWKGFDNAP
ncbi:MAG: hypothetical protein KIT45_08305 [Fimbriimonadia bacterium]|nr:hypothetical protein [Fimbriimonadia bacterium]